MNKISYLLKIDPYRKEARQLSGWALFSSLLAMAAFAVSAYIGMNDAGWKLLILGIASTFWALLLFGRIAEQEQTANIIETMHELAALEERENVA